MEELGDIYERHAIFNSGYDVSIWFIQYLAHAAQVVQSLLDWWFVREFDIPARICFTRLVPLIT